jgi:integrase
MYESKAGHLLRILGGVDVNVIHLDHVGDYIGKRLEEGAARGTVYKELVTLRQALRLAHDRGIMVRDPRGIFPRFTARYHPRQRWLTTDELAKLVAVLPDNRRAWVLLAVFSGARSSEVEALTWEDHVNLSEGWMFIPGTKTQKSRRHVPLSTQLRELLDVLPNRKGRLVQAWGNVRRDLEVACRHANIARVSPNDFRRSFASWLKQASVDSLAVAKLLGHSSTRMVELVYGHLDLSTFRRAVAELPPMPEGALDGMEKAAAKKKEVG